MFLRHSPAIWRSFPSLAAGAIFTTGISRDVSVETSISRLSAIARNRLDGGSESELPEIQAWRRTFSKMGLRPTQYRCAAEALLRRFRQDGALPRIHPLIDFCNAYSLAFAIPIAVFDTSRIAGLLEVRHAVGNETYLTFAGTVEAPDAGEVVFADDSGRAHARRWTNRQSGYSAVRDETRDVLIVVEAMHEPARDDIARLVADLTDELRRIWRREPTSAALSAASPQFEY